MSNELKYKKKLEKAKIQIRILEDMVEARTRELYTFNAELENRVIQRTAELKNIIQELEQLTYIVSHDLKSPLANISGLVDVLGANLKSTGDESSKQIIRLMKQSTYRMRSLIEDILEHSLIGTQKNIGKVDCNILLQEIQDDLHKLLKDNNAHIQAGELPTLSGYKTELRQLFQNLISNAIKFRKVDIDPAINIKANQQVDKWQFSVQDNGIGIEAQNHEKIFGTFQRIHHDENYEGHGIGLANCKKIIQLHDGEIWVDSDPGKGATFHFTLTDQNDIESNY